MNKSPRKGWLVQSKPCPGCILGECGELVDQQFSPRVRVPSWAGGGWSWGGVEGDSSALLVRGEVALSFWGSLWWAGSGRTTGGLTHSDASKHFSISVLSRGQTAWRSLCPQGLGLHSPCNPEFPMLYCPLQGLRNHFFPKKRPLPFPPSHTTHCLSPQLSVSWVPLSPGPWEVKRQMIIDEQNRLCFVMGILPICYNSMPLKKICCLFHHFYFLRRGTLIEPSCLQNEWESNLLSRNFRTHSDERVGKDRQIRCSFCNPPYISHKRKEIGTTPDTHPCTCELTLVRQDGMTVGRRLLT